VSRIAIGSDHAGYLLKQHFIEVLEGAGMDVIDHARTVRDGKADFGIVLGGSGQGEQLAANKVHGIRAALCNDLFTARLARQHNDANVLSIGARVVGEALADEILMTFLGAQFEGGRHQKRVDQISEIERAEFFQ
jgi:ribose 5-phosphate isomerase B